MYDLAVIGAGWAGFNAAIAAKKQGRSVCLIEQSEIGGTCLNRGCIPTKTLIQSAKIFELSKKAKNFGVSFQEPVCSFSDVLARKEKIIGQLRQGMQSQLAGIDLVSAKAHFINESSVSCAGRTIEAKAFLLATGSAPASLGQLPFDGVKFVSSEELLSRREVPRSLCIIGGGVIGCEFACIFSALGSSVTVVELMAQLIPGEDPEIARKLEISLKKKGIKVFTSTDCATLDMSVFDTVLVSIGRTANTSGLALSGLKTGKTGFIVDDHLRTSVPAIWAAGDCTGKLLLAHFAAYQGKIAAHNIINPDGAQSADNTTVPACIFTSPEIASVGLSEPSAAARNIKVRVYKRDFLSSGMARILDEAEGFIKIVSEAESGRVLGACIIGPRATELIAVFCVAVTNGLTIRALGNTIFAHPSVAEIICDALD